MIKHRLAFLCRKRPCRCGSRLRLRLYFTATIKRRSRNVHRATGRHDTDLLAKRSSGIQTSFSCDRVWIISETVFWTSMINSAWRSFSLSRSLSRLSFSSSWLDDRFGRRLLRGVYWAMSWFPGVVGDAIVRAWTNRGPRVEAKLRSRQAVSTVLLHEQSSVCTRR